MLGLGGTLYQVIVYIPGIIMVVIIFMVVIIIVSIIIIIIIILIIGLATMLIEKSSLLYQICRAKCSK